MSCDKDERDVTLTLSRREAAETLVALEMRALARTDGIADGVSDRIRQACREADRRRHGKATPFDGPKRYTSGEIRMRIDGTDVTFWVEHEPSDTPAKMGVTVESNPPVRIERVESWRRA